MESCGETQSGFPLLTSRHERDAIAPASDGAPDGFERELVSWLATAHDPFQRMGAADLASWLPDDLLIKADRMTMAASIEGRAPFLMPKLVERALSLPISQKYSGATSKVLLRQLARKLLPPTVVDRRKHGFVLPMASWVRDWFHAHGGFGAYMHDGQELHLNLQALERLYEGPDNHGRERLYFALIVLIEWWKAFKQEISALRS